MSDGSRPTVQVVGAALVDDLELPSRLLAARRSAPSRLAGGWELPGGKVEPGEDAHQALRRELVEELGVDVVLGPRVTGPLEGGWPLGQDGRLEVFLARAEQEPRALQDHDELRWLPLLDPFGVAWLEADVPVVVALRDRLLVARLVVLPDREDAEALADGWRAGGVAAGVHRELLAGDDDLEDAQWVVALDPGPAALALDDLALAVAAEQHDGWVERHQPDR